jgi:tetratricopeptide (TPR) repeat protein
MSSTRSNFVWWRVAFVSVLLLGLGVFIVLAIEREPVDRLLHKGQKSLLKGDFQQAAEFAEQILERDPQLTEALHLAGSCSMNQRNYQQALEYFDRIRDETSLGSIQARCISGELLMLQIKHLSAAEDQFRRALYLDPENKLANDNLAYLLGLSTRSWEATRYRLQIVMDKRASREQLLVLAVGDQARHNPDVVEGFRESVRNDPAVQLAIAVQAIDKQEYSQAKKLLNEVIRRRPLLIAAHVRMGQLLLATGQGDEFLAWHQKLPKEADTHPGIWAIQGQWARRNNQERIAVRCLWESVRLAPNVQQTNLQLGQALIALNRSKEAEPFLERAERLQQYLLHAHTAIAAKPGEDVDELLDAATDAGMLGLYWEALSWARLVLLEDPGNYRARQLIKRIMPGTEKPPPSRCHPNFNLALRVDYSGHPEPDWNPRATKK